MVIEGLKIAGGQCVISNLDDQSCSFEVVNKEYDSGFVFALEYIITCLEIDKEYWGGKEGFVLRILYL